MGRLGAVGVSSFPRRFAADSVASLSCLVRLDGEVCSSWSGVRGDGLGGVGGGMLDVVITGDDGGVVVGVSIPSRARDRLYQASCSSVCVVGGGSRLWNHGRMWSR